MLRGDLDVVAVMGNSPRVYKSRSAVNGKALHFFVTNSYRISQGEDYGLEEKGTSNVPAFLPYSTTGRLISTLLPTAR
jgi:hypothetical protein